jgi:hypothetical protein
MGKTDMRVSEHALLRYAERVLGFDREQVIADLARLVGGAVQICPDCRVPFTVGGGEFVAVVENRTVKTILLKQTWSPPPKPKKPKAFRDGPDVSGLQRKLGIERA